MDFKTEFFIEGLRQGWVMRFKSVGASMLPFLRTGDIITIYPGNLGRIGDIVLYPIGQALMLHRVVAKIGGKVITKGDAMLRPDRPINSTDILGRAVSRERKAQNLNLDSDILRFFGLGINLTLSWLPILLKYFGTGVGKIFKNLGV